MMQEDDIDDRDEALVDELRGAAARLDPVPEVVLMAGHAAIELRDLDAQLAELLSDSATEDKELTGVRGGAGRLLTFGLGDRFVEVEISGTGDAREATGYVVPARAGRLVAETARSMIDAVLDAQGRFRLVGLPTGPTRLRFELPGAEPLVTPWTTF